MNSIRYGEPIRADGPPCGIEEECKDCPVYGIRCSGCPVAGYSRGKLW